MRKSKQLIITGIIIAMLINITGCGAIRTPPEKMPSVVKMHAPKAMHKTRHKAVVVAIFRSGTLMVWSKTSKDNAKNKKVCRYLPTLVGRGMRPEL